MSLLINLATRGRPALLIETITATLANIVRDDTVLMVSADDDDRLTIDALKALANKTPERCNHLVFRIAPREDTIGAKWNRALSFPADLYMPMVDHTIPTTKGFDQKILDAASVFPDGICAVHTHMANLSFAAYNAISRKWAETLGEIYPTYFPYWFVDHWTDDLARMIGRIAYADVAFDASRKPPTQEMREPGWWATWYDAARDLRHDQASKLVDAMDVSDAQKANLKTGLTWIYGASAADVRSRLIINDGVRVQDRQLSTWSGLSTKDERYQRVRQRAVDMVPELLTRFDAASAAAYRNALAPPVTIANLQRAYA